MRVVYLLGFDMLRYYLVTRSGAAYTARAGVFLFVMLAALLLTLPRLGEVQLSDYASHSCTSLNAKEAAPLNILVPAPLIAGELVRNLCERALIAARFDPITVFWRHRGDLSAEDLLSGRYQLLWNRNYILQGLVPRYSDFYVTLLELQPYSVYWYSRERVPRLSDKWLRGKRIGLSRDRQSQSGYLLPMGELRAAGVDVDALQIYYARDSEELVKMYSRGELDLFSAVDEAQLLFRAENPPVFHRSLIQRGESSGAWYIQKQLAEPGLRCELKRALKLQSALAGSSFYTRPQTADDLCQ